MSEAIPCCTTQEQLQETHTNNFFHPSSLHNRFSLLHLRPTPTTMNTTFTLRRCSSAPLNPADIPNPNPAAPPSTTTTTTHSPPENAGLPPLPPPSNGSPLLRTLSDPNPFSPLQSPAPLLFGGACDGGGSRSHSRSPVSGDTATGFTTGADSPASKRLKRMSERMREMKQWVDEVITENDQDFLPSENYFSPPETTDKVADAKNEENNISPYDTTDKVADAKNEGKLLQEETVSAEREGDAINIRFKCPCGNSYHILLMGQHCYYKLL